jgi:ADP-heptose:LPS heptosyltransferase
MGDLILSFPLFLWLKRLYPKTPIWTVAEKDFYSQLMGISPQVTYIPWTGYRHVMDKRFSLVINLSHREEAAWLAGQVDCEEIVGSFRDGHGALRINGDWQLYRASLVHNNRFNRFHWADMNALDAVPPAKLAETRWTPPRQLSADNKSVGVFIGASQKSKRPGAGFWISLLKSLTARGLKPIILGGPGEKELAGRIKSGLGLSLADFTGRTDLSQLVYMGQALQLLITPDTGPMHLAAWSGLRVLNLSFGPVHPWETGPYQPGHLVLGSSRSCRRCWECRFKYPFCRDDPDPVRVAGLARAWIKGDKIPPDSAGVQLLRTGRSQGLYALLPAGRENSRQRAGETLSAFWQAYWMYWFGVSGKKGVLQAQAGLRNSFPRVHAVLEREVKRLLSQMNSLIAKRDIPDMDFWKTCPPAFRPLRGYLQLYWQNYDFDPGYIRRSLGQVEEFIAILQQD